MKVALALGLGLGLAGCNANAGGAPDVMARAQNPFSQQAEFASKRMPYVAALIVADYQLAAQHKITFVQAAKEVKDAVSHTFGAYLDKSLALELDYAIVIAQKIDAGKISPEEGTYLRQQKHFEIENAVRAVAPPPPSPPVTCLSTPIGNMAMTTCD